MDGYKLKRAKEILAKVESENPRERKATPKIEADSQLDMSGMVKDSIIDRLRMIDITTVSPIEALNILNDLKNKADEA